jgi:hypothetical protein
MVRRLQACLFLLLLLTSLAYSRTTQQVARNRGAKLGLAGGTPFRSAEITTAAKSSSSSSSLNSKPFNVLLSRDLISTLQQGVSTFGSGLQRFLGTDSNVNNAKTAVSEGVQNALGREF